MLVLVDGRNVQRSRWPNVADEELVAAVEAWAAREGHEAIVVFDGEAPDGAVGTGGESADDWIARRAAQLTARDVPYRLVTSDRELRLRAGVAAHAVTGGGRFLSLLGLR